MLLVCCQPVSTEEQIISNSLLTATAEIYSEAFSTDVETFPVLSLSGSYSRLVRQDLTFIALALPTTTADTEYIKVVK